MGRGKKSMLLLAQVAALGLSCDAIADTSTIYVSYGADGSPRFSSQAYDSSYAVFIKGEERTPLPSTRSRRSSGQVRARERIESLIQTAARKHHLEPALLRSVIEAESGFNHLAVSPKGAVGLMQVLPATGRRYGITRLVDPIQNIEAGARYLKELLVQFDANLPLTLAAYNAGEGAVKRHAGRIPPYRETMLYVPTVLTAYAAYRQTDGSESRGMQLPPPTPNRDDDGV